LLFFLIVVLAIGAVGLPAKTIELGDETSIAAGPLELL